MTWPTTFCTGSTSNGLPAGVALRVGAPGNRRTFALGRGANSLVTLANLSRFDVYLNSLQVGPSANSVGKGDLDLLSAEVVCDGVTNLFYVAGTLTLGGNYSETTYLRIPGTVTST